MKTRLLLAVAGLAICSALPTFAQQTNKPDPQLRQRLIALIKIHTDATNKNDATAIASELHRGRGYVWNKIRTDFRSGGYSETLGRPVPESAFQQQRRHVVDEDSPTL